MHHQSFHNFLSNKNVQMHDQQLKYIMSGLGFNNCEGHVQAKDTINFSEVSFSKVYLFDS